MFLGPGEKLDPFSFYPAYFSLPFCWIQEVRKTPAGVVGNKRTRSRVIYNHLFFLREFFTPGNALGFKKKKHAPCCFREKIRKWHNRGASARAKEFFFLWRELMAIEVFLVFWWLSTYKVLRRALGVIVKMKLLTTHASWHFS